MATSGSGGKKPGKVEPAGSTQRTPEPATGRAVDLDEPTAAAPAATRAGGATSQASQNGTAKGGFLSGLADKMRGLASKLGVASIANTSGLEKLSKERMEALKISSRFGEDDLIKLYAYYQRIDKDKQDFITSEQLKEFPPIGLNPLCQRIITCLEFRDPTKISFEDFCTSTSVFSARYNAEKKTRFAFKIYDIDQDGKIGKSDLTNIFSLTLTGPDGTSALTEAEFDEFIKRTLSEADSDGDGFISYEDFAKVVTGTDFKSRMTFNL